MDEIAELRQELIIDHSRRPRNFGELSGHNCHAHGDNPLCGDSFEIELIRSGDLIEDVRFHGVGCGMSTASASVMTDAIKGQTVEEAMAMFARFRALVLDRSDLSEVDAFDRIAVMATGARAPMRAKCLTLAWHTMKAALVGEDGTVSTE